MSDGEAARETEAGDHRALEQELAYDPAPARSECEPDGDLALAGGAPGELEARDVRARDEQDESDRRADEGQERDHTPAVRGPEPGLATWQHLNGPVAILGVGRCELRRADPKRRAGCLDRHAGPEAADDQRNSSLAPVESPSLRDEPLELVEPADRHPEVGRVAPIERHAAEAIGRDSDDREVPAVNADGAARDRRVAAEGALPEAVADHHDGMRSTRVVLAGPEAPAERHSKTQHVEVVCADQLSPQELRTRTVIEAEWCPIIRHQAGEDLGLIAELGVVRIRNRGPLALGGSAVDGDEAIGLAPGERPEQNRVREGEERRRHADPERQAQNGHRGEARAPPKRAERKPETAKHLRPPVLAYDRRPGNRRPVTNLSLPSPWNHLPSGARISWCSPAATKNQRHGDAEFFYSSRRAHSLTLGALQGRRELSRGQSEPPE